MKKVLLCGIALSALSLPAAAADLARSYPVKAPIVAAPVFSWTGFYLGGMAGYGWGKFDSGASDISPRGWYLGGQVGYNVQFYNMVVLGIEADFAGGNITATDSFAGTALTLPQSYVSTIDYFGTIRARVGYALGNFLPYVTGGAAWAHNDISVAAYPLAGGVIVGSDSATQWGWTIGGGVEYAFWNNISLKLEYLYADFGSSSYTPAGFLPSDNSLTLQTVRFGVNTKF